MSKKCRRPVFWRVQMKSVMKQLPEVMRLPFCNLFPNPSEDSSHRTRRHHMGGWVGSVVSGVQMDLIH